VAAGRIANHAPEQTNPPSSATLRTGRCNATVIGADLVAGVPDGFRLAVVGGATRVFKPAILETTPQRQVYLVH
jgi:hypothetical protein